MIAIKGDWLAAAVKAGCATSLVADWNSGANDELNYLEIKLVDLLNGNLAARRTFAFAKSKSNNEANAARQKADTRRPEF